MATNIITITDEAKVAFKGSLESPTPAPKKEFIFLDGKTLSFANACNVLGAIRIEPIADEMVAAARPIGMIGPQIAILLMIS